MHTAEEVKKLVDKWENFTPSNGSGLNKEEDAKAEDVVAKVMLDYFYGTLSEKQIQEVEYFASRSDDFREDLTLAGDIVYDRVRRQKAETKLA